MTKFCKKTVFYGSLYSFTISQKVEGYVHMLSCNDAKRELFCHQRKKSSGKKTCLAFTLSSCWCNRTPMSFFTLGQQHQLAFLCQNKLLVLKVHLMLQHFHDEGSLRLHCQQKLGESNVQNPGSKYFGHL